MHGRRHTAGCSEPSGPLCLQAVAVAGGFGEVGLAEFADSASLMYQQPAASGRKYQGRNETFWEHQGEATVVWGYGSPEMKCQAK